MKSYATVRYREAEAAASLGWHGLITQDTFFKLHGRIMHTFCMDSHSICGLLETSGMEGALQQQQETKLM
jgi:hypothetical protein